MNIFKSFLETLFVVTMFIADKIIGIAIAIIFPDSTTQRIKHGSKEQKSIYSNTVRAIHKHFDVEIK